MSDSKPARDGADLSAKRCGNGSVWATPPGCHLFFSPAPRHDQRCYCGETTWVDARERVRELEAELELAEQEIEDVIERRNEWLERYQLQAKLLERYQRQAKLLERVGEHSRALVDALESAEDVLVEFVNLRVPDDACPLGWSHSYDGQLVVRAERAITRSRAVRDALQAAERERGKLEE